MGMRSWEEAELGMRVSREWVEWMRGRMMMRVRDGLGMGMGMDVGCGAGATGLEAEQFLPRESDVECLGGQTDQHPGEDRTLAKVVKTQNLMTADEQA